MRTQTRIPFNKLVNKRLPTCLFARDYFQPIHRYKVKALEFAEDFYYDNGYNIKLKGSGSTRYLTSSRLFFEPDIELRESVIFGIHYLNFKGYPDTNGASNSTQYYISGNTVVNNQSYEATGVNSVLTEEYTNLPKAPYIYSPYANTNNEVMLSLRDANQDYIWENLPITSLSLFNQTSNWNEAISGIAWGDPPQGGEYPLVSSTAANYGSASIALWAAALTTHLNLTKRFRYNRRKLCFLNGVALENSYIQVVNKPSYLPDADSGNPNLVGLTGLGFFFGFDYLPIDEWNSICKERGELRLMI